MSFKGLKQVKTENRITVLNVNLIFVSNFMVMV